ncbi:glycosyltransferase [Bacillaceae bacterium IKA-2]|nr:glycosyltransferase [Bacillaceae bacterium IKA-2]
MLLKVSVVVPIYKVEKYLGRCVESIINQTYTNLEIILVDDGSPDNCGRMADKYAAKDNRIISVHKENGGLSDARNYGIQYVTGKFTLFVDSDDWLAGNMIEEMVNNIIEFKADVVQSAFYYAYEDHLVFDNRYYAKDEPPTILDNKALMTELVINERVKNFAWGKLYKTHLIKDIPFVKGVLFEDVFWAHQVMHRVKTYLLLHQPMFYYLQRADSIVSNYTTRNLDIIKGLKERHKFIEKFYIDLENESYKMILKTSLIHYNILLRNREKDSSGKHREEIRNYIKGNYPKLKKAADKDPQLRRQLDLFVLHPILNLIYVSIRKLLRMVKIISEPIKLERIYIK